MFICNFLCELQLYRTCKLCYRVGREAGKSIGQVSLYCNALRQKRLQYEMS